MCHVLSKGFSGIVLWAIHDTDPVSENIIIVIIIQTETFGVFNCSARLVLNEIGKRISSNTGRIREKSFLFLLVSSVGAILLHHSAGR